MSTIQLWAPPFVTAECVVEKVKEWQRLHPKKPPFVRFLQDYLDSTWPTLWHLKTTFDITIDRDTVTTSTVSTTMNEICAICRCALNLSVEKLPCQHVFHTMCLYKWLQYAPTCPICRAQVRD